MKPKKKIVPALILLSVLTVLMFLSFGIPDAKENGAVEQLGATDSPAPYDGMNESYEEADQAINADNVAVPESASVSSGVQYTGALIVFTFDDGNASDYHLAFPILKKYGITGTSFINPNDADSGAAHKLSWNQILEMYEQGWDFEDHTYSHIDLSKSTPEQIRRSMEQVDEAFQKNGLRTPSVFAYPYGKFDQAAVVLVREYRKQARLAYYRDDFVDPKNGDPYQIPCVSADMQTEKRLKEKETLVDRACLENGVIVFRVHCLYKNELNDMGAEVVQTSSVLFEKLVSYCVDKGCTFTTMDNLAAKAQLVLLSG
jgi:peptidoglycan/xylan/chitin deacetylase (PgdA/CDA1 family)